MAAGFPRGPQPELNDGDTQLRKYIMQEDNERSSYNNNTTLLPSVSTVALEMFCGAKYIHHTFTPIIKHH